MRFILAGVAHQRIQKQVLLTAFRAGSFRLLLLGVLLRSGPLNLTADRGHIDGRELEALKNAVDLAGILGTDHHIGNAVRSVPVLQHTVENSVTLSFLAEFHKVLVLDGKDLQLFSALQHICEAGLAFGLLLVFKDSIEQERNFLGPLAGNSGGDFSSF